MSAGLQKQSRVDTICVSQRTGAKHGEEEDFGRVETEPMSSRCVGRLPGATTAPPSLEENRHAQGDPNKTHRGGGGTSTKEPKQCSSSSKS